MIQSEVHTWKCYYYSSGSSLANERPGSLTADLKSLTCGGLVAPSRVAILVLDPSVATFPPFSSRSANQPSFTGLVLLGQACHYQRRGLWEPMAGGKEKRSLHWM